MEPQNTQMHTEGCGMRHFICGRGFLHLCVLWFQIALTADGIAAVEAPARAAD